MKSISCVLLFLASIGYGQVDKPVSQDLADQLKAERTKFDETANILSAVREYLNVSAGSNDLNKLAAVADADLHICLAKHDYHRREGELYEQAAVAAGQVAEAWERKASTPAVTATEESFMRQMEDLERRAAELGGKSDLTEDERGEMVALERRRTLLQEALKLLAQSRSSWAEPAMYGIKAKQMRSKERTFQLRAEDFRLQALVDEVQCKIGLETLRKLGERAQVQKEFDGWEAIPLDEPGNPIASQRKSESRIIAPQKLEYEKVPTKPSANGPNQATTVNKRLGNEP
jgi:hypothetical protein